MNRVSIGLGLIGLLLISLFGGFVGVGYAQEDDLVKAALIEEIRVYAEMIERMAAVVPNESIVQEALAFVANVTSSDLTALTVDELRSIRDEIAGYFEAVKELLPSDILEEEDIEKAVMESVIEILSVVAEKYNVSTVEELYLSVVEDFRNGNYELALNKLEDIAIVLNELSVSDMSDDLVESAIEFIRSIMSNGNNTTQDIYTGIERIESAMEILSDLRSYLIEAEADEAALLAVDLAIATLDSTLQILQNVAETVGNNTLPGVVEEAVNNTLAEKLLREIG